MVDEVVPPVGLIGRTIAGKYAIESLLGVGAMGAVFKARHLGLEQTVAIKVMHSHFLSEPRFAERFRREAQATVRLDHPNSVRVLDFGEEPDGLLYLVMELLDGRDLAHVIVEDWPLSNERIAGIVRQIVGALGAAHDAEIIHRDLKPENIMVLSRVNDDGEAVDVCKVCDFGIAQLGDPRTSRTPPATTKLTSRGLIIGTPEYMSPEQGRGDPLDARADLYAVGVILYELLTGQLPFTGDSAIGIILKHASHPVTPPSELRSSVHPGLEEICLRAMRKDASVRFQSAREMRAALIALGTELPESPSSVGPAAILRSETETAMSVAAPAKKKHAPSRVVVSVVMLVALLPVVAWGSRSLLTPVAVAPATLSAPAPIATPAEKSANMLPSLELTASAINGAPPSILRQPASLPNTAPAPVLRKSVGRPSEREIVPATSAVIAVAPEIAPAAAHADPPPPPAVITTPVPEAPSRPAPAFEASNARVTVGAVSNEQGVLRRDVVSAVTRLGRTMTGCYQDDLRLTMIPKNGPGTLHLETDGSGTVVKAHARVPFSPAMASCIERAVTGVRIAGVDTGDAAADVALQFDLQ